MMLSISIYYKYSAVPDNKHELIQVTVAANVTTQKTFHDLHFVQIAKAVHVDSLSLLPLEQKVIFALDKQKAFLESLSLSYQH